MRRDSSFSKRTISLTILYLAQQLIGEYITRLIRLLSHRRHINVQRRLVPDDIRLLGPEPVLTVVGECHVEVIDDLGQDEAHLRIRQASSFSTSAPYLHPCHATVGGGSGGELHLLPTDAVARPDAEGLHRIELVVLVLGVAHPPLGHELEGVLPPALVVVDGPLVDLNRCLFP